LNLLLYFRFEVGSLLSGLNLASLHLVQIVKQAFLLNLEGRLAAIVLGLGVLRQSVCFPQLF